MHDALDDTAGSGGVIPRSPDHGPEEALMRADAMIKEIARVRATALISKKAMELILQFFLTHAHEIAELRDLIPR